ncbi:hypothetical protein L1987_12815 [Smallanthus sonchifolius]|uniref:Uncharacterized protein n=1 Tax=Smallanthus sonchifolius TaxID=185202 RepID=A0ACB9JES6_9ASTR|nr:hypothetical protein L1987_12815 [Smallanthus sonchifolius]
MIREGLKRHYGNPVQYTLLMERAPSHPAILPQWPHQYRRDGNLRPIWMLPLPKGIHRKEDEIGRWVVVCLPVQTLRLYTS